MPIPSDDLRGGDVGDEAMIQGEVCRKGDGARASRKPITDLHIALTRPDVVRRRPLHSSDCWCAASFGPRQGSLVLRVDAVR
jgi:hypothetical protein